MDAVLDHAAPFIARWEGFSAVPYRDIAGYWTIGYGARTLEDGSPVLPTTPPISREDAMHYIWSRCAQTYLPAVRRSLMHYRPTDAQLIALTSLCYNIGPGALATSDLIYRLDAGDVAGAADAFLSWNKARDPHTHILTVSRGLVNRRQAERALFLSDSVAALPTPAEIATVLAAAPHPTADDLNDAELRRVKGNPP